MPRKGHSMPDEERAKRCKSAEEKRSKNVMLRLTQEEAAKLDERRAASGRRRTEQIVHDLFSRADPQTTDLTPEQRRAGSELAREVAEVLGALTPEVGRVGANVNQISRRTNLAAAALKEDPRTRSDQARAALANLAKHGPVMADAVHELGALRDQIERLDKQLSTLLIRLGARW